MKKTKRQRKVDHILFTISVGLHLLASVQECFVKFPGFLRFLYLGFVLLAQFQLTALEALEFLPENERSMNDRR